MNHKPLTWHKLGPASKNVRMENDKNDETNSILANQGRNLEFHDQANIAPG